MSSRLLNYVAQWVDKWKTAYQSLGSEERIKKLEKELDEWKEAPLNVAVIGYTGVGKSTFINAIRHLAPDDRNRAETGAAKETTVEIRSYPHPNNPNLLFWDLPGVGTKRFPKDSYLSAIKVDDYDFFLLMTASRFTKIDTWLGQEIGNREKKYFFIRTQVGVDVFKEAGERSEKEVVEEISQYTETQLKDNGCENVPRFLIDGKQTGKYDFEQLEIQLVNHFPELKRSALILSVQASSEAMIMLKVEELRLRIWKNAVASATVGAVPIPGVSFVFDTALVAKEVIFYFEQLGLDSASLKRRAKLLSTDYEKLHSIVGERIGDPAGSIINIVKGLVVEAGALASTAAIEEGTKLVPVIGFIIGVTASFVGTYAVLTLILNKMEKTALEVVKCRPNEDLTRTI